MKWKKGQSGNPRGRMPTPVERLFVEQLQILAQENVNVPIEEPSKKPVRHTKANAKAMQDDKKRNFRLVRKLRRMAEVAFEKALEGSIDHMKFVADRLDGKPTATRPHQSQQRVARDPSGRH